MTEEQIIQLLEIYFSNEEELADCFVTDLKISGSRIFVYVDSDSAMNFEKCRKISRFLEKHFDESLCFGEKYMLEVSSPGIGKPLMFKRQYAKNIGRKVDVTLKEGNQKLSGILKEVNENDIVIERELKIKQGKKKIKELHQDRIEDADIEKIIVKVSF